MKLSIKKIFIVFFTIGLIFNTISCKNVDDIETTEKLSQTNKKNIAISLPTKKNARWNSDGNFLKKSFANLGYDVNIIYSDNILSHQFRDVKELINSNFDAIIIAPIDKNALSQIINTANGKNVKIISYDDIINDTDCVDYSIRFDDYLIGKMNGEYIEKKLNLKNSSGKKYNIEIFTGDSSDEKSKNRYDGLMSIIKKYIDNEVLDVLSQNVEFLDVSISNWNSATAMNKMQDIIDTYYTDTKLDAVICLDDNLARGIISAIDLSYNLLNDIIVTGEGAYPINANYILDGKQSMTIYNSNERERDLLVRLVDSILKNDGSGDVIGDENLDYVFDFIDNNKTKVPTYYINPIILEKDNIKNILGDAELYSFSDGYFTEY